MLHRITRLAPLLLILAMSGCVFFPDHGRHHDHRYYDGGPGYYHR
ncbi:hypothetical protein [Pseudomonas versuta]|jgi:hypothetical protein|nr:hypothetical protein [Pseudomonas versuta]